MRTVLLGVTVLLLVAALSASAADYTIAVEDVLSMSVWGETQLQNIRLTVGIDGNVTVPNIGLVKAEGLTIEQLATKIADAFRDKKWLKAAQVQLTMLQMHQPTISVLGSVNRPGKYGYREGDTVMEAIALAGSYQESAGLAKATLTRKDGLSVNLDLYKLYFKGDTTQNLALRNGDSLYIPEDSVRRVYVLGEVQRPGMYPLKENMTALSAVTQAGGPIPDRGKLKGTTVVRGDPANPEKLPVDIAKMIGKGDLRQDIALQPGDLVYVPKTSKPSLSDIAQILSVLSSFRYVTQGVLR